MSFALAVFPILLTIILLIWVKLSSRLALFLAWLAAAIIAVLFWQMSALDLAAWSLLGLFKAVDIILIIF
jgi:L-lactate permease